MDYVEIYDLALEADDDSPEYVTPGFKNYPEPPVANKISFSSPMDSFNYSISGAPGAVTPAV